MVSLSSISRLLWMSTLLFGLNACFATGEVTPNGDLSDVTDVADATDPSDGSDSSEQTDATDSTDASDATDGTDASEASDLSDPSGTSDVSDPTDETDTSDTTDPSDASDPSEPEPVCGNDVLEDGEGCDDGNTIVETCPYDESCTVCGSGCQEVAGLEIRCGDGITQSAFESCDDANQETELCAYGETSCVVCDAECNEVAGAVSGICGDGELQSEFETCDDNNVVTELCDYGLTECTVCNAGCTEGPGELLGYCGDGIVNGPEPCDFNDPVTGVLCDNDCTLILCGNGELDDGEECDDANDNNNDDCLDTCRLAGCGDGFVRAGVELCDDGNSSVNDSCPSGEEGTCMPATCGDAFTWNTDGGIETCDDANSNNNDGCLNACQLNVCGDGVIFDGVETCDDNNTVTERCDYGQESCTVCNASCQEVAGATSLCGDGTTDVSNNETCDDNNAVTEVCDYGDTECELCNASCQTVAGETSFCGDGIVDPDNDEECDTQGESETCDDDCTLVVCGDGNINEAAGEGCDDGNVSDNDACPSGSGQVHESFSHSQGARCQPATCGDGYRWTSDLGETEAEECDDGNTEDRDDCVPGCKVATCGDAYVWSLDGGNENCDDGDGINTDICPDGEGGTCRIAICGDGFQFIGAEDCDDAGESATCDDDCTAVICGDTNVNESAGEDCDDGGETFTCDDDCTNVGCGDENVNEAAGEECDDGNGIMTDRCAAGCLRNVCGDGFTYEGVEQCDDRGESATCDDDCTAVACLDGNVNETAGEACDDGNVSNTDACLNNCELARCGDGVTRTDLSEGEAGYEYCDKSGEAVDCDDDCTPVACLDGNLNETAGESCDDGQESQSCNNDCTPASCGDSKLNTTAGETCDDGGESATCDDDCSAVSCGDSNVNQSAGEACDDGGESATCDDDCSAVSCGDSNVNEAAGETCDDGNGNNSDACPDGSGGTCLSATCGDGFVWTTSGGSEICDDSGESATCDDDCTAVSCGDGKLNVSAGEGCDDGNGIDTDACPDGSGTVPASEPWRDQTATRCQPATCGDGFTQADVEECDAGTKNGVYSSGCTNSCEQKVCVANYQVNDPDVLDDCWVVQGDIQFQMKQYQCTPISFGGAGTPYNVDTLTLPTLGRVDGNVTIQPMYDYEVESCFSGNEIYSSSLVNQDDLTQATFSELEYISGDIAVQKKIYPAIAPTTPEIRYNSDLTMVQFSKLVSVGGNIYVSDNPVLDEIRFENTVTVEGDITESNNYSQFCFEGEVSKGTDNSANHADYSANQCD